jgi:hypothetical protein
MGGGMVTTTVGARIEILVWVKKWCSSVSPKTTKINNIGQKPVQIQISNSRMTKIGLQ